MTATAVQGQYLLIRRLLSRPDSHTFYLCWAPPDRPATMTYFITIAGRRWPVEEAFETGKDVFGWDQTQVRAWDGICRHTALAALAQLRAAAIRNTITGSITLPAANDPANDTANDTAGQHRSDTGTATGDDGTPGDGDDGDGAVNAADLQIPLGDAPIPVRGGQPCPPELGPIKLSIAETTRLAGLAARHTTGLITRTRLAFALRWSLRRRLHQARARWHHYSTRLTAAADTG
jgi:AraC-like DNA-binding protein